MPPVLFTLVCWLLCLVAGKGKPGVLVSLVRGSSGEGEGGLPEGVPREGSMASSHAPQALQQQTGGRMRSHS